MPRLLLALSLGLLLTQHALAHFIYIIPQETPDASVVLSEKLEADTSVERQDLGESRFAAVAADGAATDLTAAYASRGAWTLKGGPDATQAIFGKVTLGVRKMHNGDGHYLLVYHPKAILGATLGVDLASEAGPPVEIVPVGEPGAVKLQLMVGDKPVINHTITVLMPDGQTLEVKTDGYGKTENFEQRGRYAAWARHWIDASGEYQGQKYNQIRAYPTLVFDVGAAAEAAPLPEVPTLPQPASSLGAVMADDGWMYIYGGSITPTHNYYREAVTGAFARYRIGQSTAWESLPAGPPSQGLALAARGGTIYRVGGMQPRNEKGQPVDNHSLSDVAAYDVASGVWRDLPPLPEARSSHDAVVVGDHLIVVGGWTMLGRGVERIWATDTLMLDLASSNPQWERIRQPFVRRALAAVAHEGRVYVLAGLLTDDSVSRRIDVLDPATRTWSRAPGLPDGQRRNFFGPAACSLNGELYVSVADGALYRLNNEDLSWDHIADTTPRLVHRMLPHAASGTVLILGGGTRNGPTDLIEAVRPVQ